jgi:AraC-like DNA-binding protein
MAAKQYPKIYLYQRVVQAKVFIDTNCTNKIDLENIADEACFSKFHFIRLFKSIYRKTPHQYLITVRIEKAKHLLQKGYLVSETCNLVGFDSLPSFSGLFKKLTGKTPSQYLHFHQLRKNQIQTKPLAFVPGCYAYMHGWLDIK